MSVVNLEVILKNILCLFFLVINVLNDLAMLEKYDTNKDGKLDEAERKAMKK